MSIAVKRMAKIDRVDTRRSIRPAVDFEEQTLLATRQLRAKNTDGPSIASDACSKTRHDEDNRHLHRTLERNSVEVSLHPITDLVHVGIDLLQFQADKNVDRRQEPQAAIDLGQCHQVARLINTQYGWPT